MSTRFLISLFTVVAATFSVAATDRFFIEDFAIQRGQTAQVEILLDNETQYTAFQADMYLPEGLTIVEGSCALTGRKASDHTLSTSILPDGAIRLMSYSMRVNAYKGNNGALVTFQVTASETLNIPATVALKNIRFTSTDGTEAVFADTQCSIYLVGDVNGDGLVNIADVTSLIDLLLANGEWSAKVDVNGDGNISIADVTTLIDLLIN